MDSATATAAGAHARRRSSISDYSSLFSNSQNKASNLLTSKTRHPSLTMSMKGERPAGFSALQRAMSGVVGESNEQAIVDDEGTATTTTTGTTSGQGVLVEKDAGVEQRRSLTDDPVGLGRRLSQGARAIMYNGNRLKGDGVALKRAPSTGSVSPSTVNEEFFSSAPVPSAAEAGKQIRRKMSPTGERMLRGELQM